MNEAYRILSCAKKAKKRCFEGIFFIFLGLLFVFPVHVSAMTFQNRNEIGEIVLSPSGIFEIEGAISHAGKPYTNEKHIQSYRINSQKNGKNIYDKGIAVFSNGREKIYFHYDSGNGASAYGSETGATNIISRLGGEDINNAVQVGIGIPTKLSVIGTDTGMLLYLLTDYDPSGLTGPTQTIIGKSSDGTYVKYFDTRSMKQQYFSDPRRFHFSDSILFYKDTIIIPYYNTGSKEQRGEFRFKWDDKAQWFGVEQVPVSPIIITTTHKYYYTSNITEEQKAQADAVARQIADYVMSQKNLKTDLEKVRLATKIVRKCALEGKYGAEENNYYRTPYGVFVAKKFTCAGTATALGRVLEFMGFDWGHVNEEKWLHQWCVLTMDGKPGHADPASGIDDAVGYGEYQSGEKAVRETMEAKGEL